MTVKELHKRLTDLIAQNEQEGRPQYNDLEVRVSIQVSPRRREFRLVDAVWGGMLTLPVPDPNPYGYKDRVVCVEMRTRDDAVRTS